MEHRFQQVLAAIVVASVLATAAAVEGQTVSSDPVLVGAGDIVPDCLAGASTANAEATAALLDALPGTVFTLGDNAYVDGTYAQFTTCYDPTWGRHRARTFPTPGNHDYHTTNAAGYFDYFNGAGNQSGPAGDRDRGYYSYNLGSWHVVVLNSECGSSGLWDVDGCAVGSAQEQWLRADLASSPTNNIVAMFHKPRFSSTYRGSAVQPLWQALYDHGADIVLNGHVHSYERLAPAGPDGSLDETYGIKQFVVGTGGQNLRTQSSTLLNISEVADDTAHGVLKLTLHESSYDWEFIPVAGDAFSDSGTAAVHGPPGSTAVNGPPVASDSTVEATAGQGVEGQLPATDPEGQVLTYAVVTPPEKGTVTIDPQTGHFTYVPRSHGKATDTFSWRATDSEGLQGNTATVTVRFE